MQLVEIDAIEFQPAQTAFASFAKMFRISIFRPPIWPAAVEAAFCGDDETGGVWIQSFGDDFLAYAGTVGIGGVNEVDAEIDGAAKHANGFAAVGGFAPDTLARDAHRSKAEAIDFEIVSNTELAGLCGGLFRECLLCGGGRH